MPTGRLIELNGCSAESDAEERLQSPGSENGPPRLQNVNSLAKSDRFCSTNGVMRQCRLDLRLQTLLDVKQEALLMRDRLLKRCKVLTTVPRRHILAPIPDGLASLGAVSSYFSRI